MSRAVRWLIRIALGLFTLAVVLLIAGYLLLDTFTRQLLLRRTEAATGMKASIASVHVGLLSASITIHGFRLYNPAQLGGSVCLDMPDLRLEYDRAALRARQLHFKLVRLDLARVAVAQDKQGRLNFGALDLKAGDDPSREFSSSGLVFTGIDTLDLSLGSLHISNLATSQETDVNFGIRHQILHDVKSESDIAAIGVLLALRGGSASGAKGLNLGALLKGLTH
jgi:hypothetical protein